VIICFGLSLWGGDVAAQSDLSYAYVSVYGKAFRHSGESMENMDIVVDLGSSSSEKQLAENYTHNLKDYTSFAAMLNFMAGKGYKLFDTMKFDRNINGTGGTVGMHFIFEKVQTK